MRGSGENGISPLPSLFSRISNRAPILCLQLSSTHSFFTLRDQAPGSTSLLSFVSDAAVFPSPSLPKDCGFDPFRPAAGGSHRATANEQWLNVGCTQKRPLDPAAAGALRLRPGASLLQKEFARQCSSSASGIMENHNTRLTPGFTLNDLVPAPVIVAIFWGLLGPGGFNSLYQMSFQQWDCFSPCGPRTYRIPLCSWGFALPTRAPP
ncbi:Hypothetical predicted protein, partial [Lynx pardinus]